MWSLQIVFLSFLLLIMSFGITIIKCIPQQL